MGCGAAKENVADRKDGGAGHARGADGDVNNNNFDDRVRRAAADNGNELNRDAGGAGDANGVAGGARGQRHRNNHNHNARHGDGRRGADESDEEGDDRLDDDPRANTRPRQLEGYWTAGSVIGTNSAPLFVPLKGPWSTLEKVPAAPQCMHGTIVFHKQASVTPSAAGAPAAAAVIGRLELGDDDLADGGDDGAAAAAAPIADFAPIVPLQDGRPPRPRALNNITNVDNAGPPAKKLVAGEQSSMKKRPQAQRKGGDDPNRCGPFRSMPIPRLFRAGVAARPDGDGYRDSIVFPSEFFVARAILPHSLANYSVGWVKVPAGPMSHPARGDGDSAQNLIGFLAPSKPVYDVSRDGPVSSPFTTIAVAAEGAADLNRVADEALLQRRHLHKYFLYVEKVLSVGVSLSFESSSRSIDAAGLVEPLYCPFHLAAPHRDRDASRVDGTVFSYAVGEVQTDDGASCVSPPHVENSVPLHVMSNLAAEFPDWWPQLRSSDSSVIANERETMDEVLTTLTRTQLLGLALRHQFCASLVKFLIALRATRRLQPAQPVAVKVNLGLKFRYDNHHFIAFNSHSTLQSTSHASDPPADGTSAAIGQENFLRFVDTSRSPPTAVSETVSKASISLTFARGVEQLTEAIEMLDGDVVALRKVLVAANVLPSPRHSSSDAM